MLGKQGTFLCWVDKIHFVYRHYRCAGLLLVFARGARKLYSAG